MWKASTTRLPLSLQGVKCRRQFSLTRQKGASGDQRCAYNPPPPPPGPPLPPVKSGRSVSSVLIKLIGVGLVGSGGVLTYAWFEPSFRSTLEDKVPYSKEVMDTLFAYIPDKVSMPSFNVPSPDSGKPKKPPGNDAKPLSFVEPKEVEDKAKSQEKKKESESALSPKEEQRRLATQKLKEKEEEEAAENAALEVILENLQQRVEESTGNAIAAQKKLIEATKRHTTLLKQAMEDHSQILEKDKQWQEVAEAYKEKESLASDTHRTVSEARRSLDYLKSALDDGKSNKVTKRNKTLSAAQDVYTRVNNEIRAMSAEVSKSESDSRVMVRYKDLIDKGRKQFAQELESIINVKLGAKSKKLTEEELNALIAHAHRRIEQLQRQVAEQTAMETRRVEQALDQQKIEDDKLAMEMVAAEIERLKEEFSFEKQQWDSEAQVDFEKELRQQLARQAAAHSDHLKDVLRVQGLEMERQCERELHTQLLQERQSFQSEVAGWIARLKGIESAVEARAESEKIARVAQDLWLACIALNGIIRHGNEAGEEWEARLLPIRKEIYAISDAGGKHPFVETLIMAIPSNALDRGVWTEDSLRERFPKVNRVCRRVAMVDETGGTLFRYFLSYIQSFFVFNSVFAKSERDVIVIDNLDTFTALGHAEHWLERGDLEMAVRFMNQLKGEPRRVASDWIREAKLLLETRQVAYALTAFASASGLGTIF